MIHLKIEHETNLDKDSIAKQLHELADKIASGEREFMRSEIWKGDNISMSVDYVESEMYLALVTKSRRSVKLND